MTAAGWLVEIEARLMPTNDGQTDTDDVPDLLAALRAVLALHTPVWCNALNDYQCVECGADLTDATPDCPTVRAITAHLDPS